MASTTINGYPYPEETDRVRDGAVAIQQLAELLDARIPRMAGGSLILSGAADAQREAVITFPDGRFDGTPNVQVTNRTSGSTMSTRTEITASYVNKTNFTIVVYRNTSADVRIDWMAIKSPESNGGAGS